MLEITPRWWIGKDSLGIVYDVTHWYNLGKNAFLHTNNCLPAY